MDTNLAIIILQSLALFFSEILPFIKTEKNGLAHAIFCLLSSKCISDCKDDVGEIEVFSSITLDGQLKEERVDTFGKNHHHSSAEV